MRLRRSLVLFLLFLSPSLGAEDSAPGRLIKEDWMAMYLKDTPIGWTHSCRYAANGPDGERFVSVEESEMTIQRMGSSLKTVSHRVEVETADGQVLRFERTRQSSGQEVVTKGEVHGDELTLSFTTAGETRTRKLRWDPAAMGSYAAERMMRAKGLQPGTAYSWKSFSIETATLETNTNTVVGPERVDVLGQPQELVLVEITTTEIPGVTVKVWVDPEVDPVKMVMPFLGGITQVRVAKEVALAKSEAAPPDAMVAGFVPVNVQLPHPMRLSAVTYVLRAKEGTLAGLVIPEGLQKVTPRGDASGSLTLRVESAAPTTPAAFPVHDPAFAEYLESNSYLQSDMPELAAAAKEAVGAETDLWKAAKKLERWVFESITKKNYGVGFATAREVFLSREGDCTEHGVLLAAMLRAVGIPSRLAAGLLYYKGVFGGHMWTEANAGGQWYPLDATLAEPVVDATHLTMSESSFHDQTPAKAMRNLAGFQDRLTIEVERFTLDGHEIEVGPGFQEHAIAGNRYTQVLLGLHVDKPEGWTFLPSQTKFDAALVEIFPAAHGPPIRTTAEAVGYAFRIDEVKKAVRMDAALDQEKSWEIDGRKAWSFRIVRKKSGGSVHVALILDGDMLVKIALAGDAEDFVKAWEAVVASLGFGS